ncbi:sensory histidine kinase DcuS [Salmonella enterica subsp. enterica serovar Enteritidis str. 76-2651]|nr:sensory histidine kinase DcuS [Salmonella enterica subsp. enterica serovar Enteritidis str. 76-2651]
MPGVTQTPHETRHYRHSDGQRRFVSVLVVVHLIYFSQISSMTRDALADKALAVARSLADSPAIREGLKKPPAESGIQPLAEAVSQH